MKKIEKLEVNGLKPLSGDFYVQGAKNSVLPILVATILGKESDFTIRNVPAIIDVDVMDEILTDLGLSVQYHPTKSEINVKGTITNNTISPKMCAKIRASTLFLGPMLTHFNEVVISYPGGDKIGDRPIDIHLENMKYFGVDIEISGGNIIARVEDTLKPADIFLRFPSVGATEHFMTMAASIEGETIIRNAAQEPEIVDLANFLGRMGAKIIGAGTSKIKIIGTSNIKSAEHTIIYDRLEVATVAVAGLVTNSNIRIHNVVKEHNWAFFSILDRIDAQYKFIEDSVVEIFPSQLKGNISCQAMFYPGLATDLQPIVTVLAAVAEGDSTVSDIVHMERFSHVSEFRRFGVDITHSGNGVRVFGGKKTIGTEVNGTDIRSFTALLCMALASEGKTFIQGVSHMDRGHGQFVSRLRDLNADVSLVLD